MSTATPANQPALVVLLKKKKTTVDYSANLTINTLITKLGTSFHLNTNRIRLSYTPQGQAKPVFLNDKQGTLQSYDIPPGSTINAKDLGPQLAFLTVFLVEYAGPFFIFPLFFVFTNFIHSFYNPGVKVEHFHYVQWLALVMWVLHYGKRLYETVFVHTFSHGTMPARNIIKNSSYYWFFAILIAYVISHPLYTPPFYSLTKNVTTNEDGSPSTTTSTYTPTFLSYITLAVGVTIWIFAEVMNLLCHLHLSSLRKKKGPDTSTTQNSKTVSTSSSSTPASSSAHPVPSFWPFKLVVCPNYTFEILGWLAYSITTVCFVSFVFTLCGFLQMWAWAIKKKKRYVSEHPEYPKKRKVIIPFLL